MTATTAILTFDADAQHAIGTYQDTDDVIVTVTAELNTDDGVWWIYDDRDELNTNHREDEAFDTFEAALARLAEITGAVAEPIEAEGDE